MRLSVVGEHIANVEVRKPQDVFQVLLVLVAIQAPHGSAAVLCHIGEIGLENQWRKLPQHLRPVASGEWHALGRHLAFLDAIVNSHPELARNAVAEFETQ